VPLELSATSGKVLDVAERLVQTVGFNGFSYADIAEELKVTKASLHYHFATKAELGTQLIARYHQNFFLALARIREEPSELPQKLRDYVALYTGVLRKNRMCLCGMLAADFATLPKPMKEGVKRFFGGNEDWVASVLEDGRKTRAFAFEGAARDAARLLVSSLEGAMMVARSFSDVERFEVAADRLLGELLSPGRGGNKRTGVS
jgi:TetR/AcrR family transcriptional repressor of nem operon